MKDPKPLQEMIMVAAALFAGIAAVLTWTGEMDNSRVLVGLLWAIVAFANLVLLTDDDERRR